MKKLLLFLIIFCLILWLCHGNITENLDVNDVQTLIGLNKIVQSNSANIKKILTKLGIISKNSGLISTNSKEIHENSVYITNLKAKMTQLKQMNASVKK